MQLGDSYSRSEEAKYETALDENAHSHVVVVFSRSSAVVQHDKHWLVVSSLAFSDLRTSLMTYLCPLLVDFPSRVFQIREGIYIQAHV